MACSEVASINTAHQNPSTSRFSLVWIDSGKTFSHRRGVHERIWQDVKHWYQKGVAGRILTVRRLLLGGEHLIGGCVGKGPRTYFSSECG